MFFDTFTGFLARGYTLGKLFLNLLVLAIEGVIYVAQAILAFSHSNKNGGRA